MVVEHDGETTLSSDIVVVSCGAANSAKLLLASANDRHPNGLANGSDQVGRNYMFHNSQAVLALSKEPNPTVFQKTLGVNDFYLKGKDVDYPLGNMQMIGKSAADMFKGEKPVETKLAPGSPCATSRATPSTSALDRGSAEPGQRVTLAEDGNVRLAYSPSNDTAAKGLFHQLVDARSSGDAPDHLFPRHAYLKTTIPVAGVAHQAGPVASVGSGDLRVGHELPRARGRQPLRRRHELLPEHRRREPRADGDGERPAGGRSPRDRLGVRDTVAVPDVEPIGEDRTERDEAGSGSSPVRDDEHLSLPVRPGHDRAQLPGGDAPDRLVPPRERGTPPFDPLLRDAARDQHRRRSRDRAGRSSSSAWIGPPTRATSGTCSARPSRSRDSRPSSWSPRSSARLAGGRLSKRVHLAHLGGLGAAGSAAFIMAANSWMQNPVGYVERGGRAELNNIWAVLTNPVFLWGYLHVLLAALVTGCIVMLACPAWHLRRDSQPELFRRTAGLSLACSSPCRSSS